MYLSLNIEIIFFLYCRFLYIFLIILILLDLLILYVKFFGFNRKDFWLVYLKFGFFVSMFFDTLLFGLIVIVIKVI